jgi:hypothetical protein
MEWMLRLYLELVEQELENLQELIVIVENSYSWEPH